MSNKGKTEKTELELMRGVWEWWYEAESTSELIIDVTMQRTARKGVFRFEALVFMPSDVSRVVPVAKYAGEWPNGRNQTLAGFMMGMMAQVERLCDDAYHDGHKPLAYPK